MYDDYCRGTPCGSTTPVPPAADNRSVRRDPAFVSSRPVSSVVSRLCATRRYRPDPTDSDDGRRCGAATFGVRRPSAIRVAVAVMGEIDALNARDLGRYVERHTGTSHQLLLDLRAVDFFGSHGFAALYDISVHCARSDVDWSIVASPAVRRLLSICDPDGELPLAEDLPSDLARLDHVTQCCHRVVHKSVRATRLICELELSSAPPPPCAGLSCADSMPRASAPSAPRETSADARQPPIPSKPMSDTGQADLVTIDLTDDERYSCGGHWATGAGAPVTLRCP